MSWPINFHGHRTTARCGVRVARATAIHTSRPGIGRWSKFLFGARPSSGLLAGLGGLDNLDIRLAGVGAGLLNPPVTRPALDIAGVDENGLAAPDLSAEFLRVDQVSSRDGYSDRFVQRYGSSSGNHGVVVTFTMAAAWGNPMPARMTARTAVRSEVKNAEVSVTASTALRSPRTVR